MKTLYECEVCGMQSEDQERVARCEANQKRPKYHEGDKVLFLFPEEEGVWLEGTITDVQIEEGTHKGIYEIHCEDKRIQAFFGSQCESFSRGDTDEDEIRLVEPT